MVVAGRSKNVGMPIAMLLHTDGAHERPGGKEIVLWGVSSLCESLQRLSWMSRSADFQGNIVLVFEFVIILLTDIGGVILVGEAVLSVTWEFI